MEMVYFKVDSFNRKIILVDFCPNNYVNFSLLIIHFSSEMISFKEATYSDSVKKKQNNLNACGR